MEKMAIGRLTALVATVAFAATTCILAVCLAGCQKATPGENPTNGGEGGAAVGSPDGVVLVGLKYHAQSMTMQPYYSVRPVGSGFEAAITLSEVYWPAMDDPELFDDYLTVVEDANYGYDDFLGADPLAPGNPFGTAVLGAAEMADLQEMAVRHGVPAWDGFAEVWKPPAGFEVLDGGDTFRLKLLFSDGTSITASGTDAFPDGYSAYALELVNYLESRCLPDAEE